MSIINREESKPQKPSIHIIKEYHKTSKSLQNALVKILMKYLNIDYNVPNMNDVSTLVRLNKTLINKRLLEDLILIEQRKSKLSSLQRRAVVSFYMELNTQPFNEENNAQERAQINTVEEI